ncbi:hypothetical protein [Variovorax sp. 54]|uniref:hypothetical protein n=1 Tax=Variovorax sp. 54 TaxID=2035212 RepID=UPI00117E1725|nr:hypothetical protein [Variovorax sp. 54]
MKKSLLGFTASTEFKLRMSESLKKTAASRARLGLPKAVVVDGVVFREYPDGRRERVNKQSPA